MYAANVNAAVADQAVVNPPSDTVQAIGWNPRANYLAGGSWDGLLRCWEISAQGASQLKAEQKFEAPLLDVSWHGDGSKIFGAGCDRMARMWDLQTNQMTPVAQHDAPIKSCIWLSGVQCLMTGGWDKMLKFWDLRQQQPAAQFQLPERCYAADASDMSALIATADRHIVAYTFQGGPRQVFSRQTNKLKMATRCVALLPTKDGFAVGTIEGRVGIQYFEDSRSADNFTFKCHNDGENFYCVNSINFHPRFGTFVTGGSDNKLFFWDKNSRMRLKSLNPAPSPVNCCRFNMDGSLMAYSAGYDWHKGAFATPTTTTSGIYIHITPDAEIQPRTTTTTTVGRSTTSRR